MSAIKFWVSTIFWALAAACIGRNPKTYIQGRMAYRRFQVQLQKVREQTVETIEQIDSILASRRVRRHLGKKRVRTLRRHAHVLQTTRKRVTTLAQLA